MYSARQWIDRLQLQPHPEGGYFRESYRSGECIASNALPDRFGGNRTFSTAIYFLLEGDSFSALHRFKQDEVWHFYDGASLSIHVIDREGNYTRLRLGRDLQQGQLPQAVVAAGCLFGAVVDDRHSYSLAGCTVAPGFDFADFELPGRESLYQMYPQHRAIIERLTH
jgi:predicted cupin superfamily sugar epimerase